MITKILKKIIALAFKPFRAHLNDVLVKHDFDIGATLQREANQRTAFYVSTFMKDVDSVTSSFDLIDKALSVANVTNGRLICEFGVFSGRSINHIASQVSVPVFGFDSFEGLPERWRDGFGKGVFKVNNLPEVNSNVQLVKGWFDKTLPDFCARQQGLVGFLHVDCDLYSSTQVIFKNLGSRIKSGTVIVFDEYFNYPGWEDGEIKAFKEFIAEYSLSYKYIGYNRLHEQVAVQIL